LLAVSGFYTDNTFSHVNSQVSLSLTFPHAKHGAGELTAEHESLLFK